MPCSCSARMRGSLLGDVIRHATNARKHTAIGMSTTLRMGDYAERQNSLAPGQ
jgi:hypothetical protein